MKKFNFLSFQNKNHFPPLIRKLFSLKNNFLLFTMPNNEKLKNYFWVITFPQPNSPLMGEKNRWDDKDGVQTKMESSIFNRQYGGSWCVALRGPRKWTDLGRDRNLQRDDGMIQYRERYTDHNVMERLCRSMCSPQQFGLNVTSHKLLVWCRLP